MTEQPHRNNNTASFTTSVLSYLAYNLPPPPPFISHWRSQPIFPVALDPPLLSATRGPWLVALVVCRCSVNKGRSVTTSVPIFFAPSGIVSFFVLNWIISRNLSWKKDGEKTIRLINLLFPVAKFASCERERKKVITCML